MKKKYRGKGMKCKLVDVFTDTRLSGNGLTIFYDFKELPSSEMLALTREMRQFESIFLTVKDSGYSARIFTVEEELDFAGHPLIGLAYHLHEEYGVHENHEWHIQLNKTTVLLTSTMVGEKFEATMNQGKPQFIHTLNHEEAGVFLSALNLDRKDGASSPQEVISTGLPYLIVPVTNGIDKAKITVDNLEYLLSKHGAKFVYVLDVNSFEGRTWDNEGKVEDVATGSAAGSAGAFLYKYGLVKSNQIILRQGRFLGRPSEMYVHLEVQQGKLKNITVSGQVCKVADMEFV